MSETHIEHWTRIDGLKGKKRKTWERFATLIEGVLEAAGAKPNDARDRWTLETVVGPCQFTVYPNSTTGPGWIASRFEDVPRACELMNPQKRLDGTINPFSGKWNHHFFDDSWTPENAAFEFCIQLNRVLETKLTLDPDGPLPGQGTKP